MKIGLCIKVALSGVRGTYLLSLLRITFSNKALFIFTQKINIKKLNPNNAVDIVDQQNYSSIISSAHILLWIEIKVVIIKTKNGIMCLRLKKNEVE
jgi:hypothetical protein